MAGGFLSSLLSRQRLQQVTRGRCEPGGAAGPHRERPQDRLCDCRACPEEGTGGDKGPPIPGAALLCPVASGLSPGPGAQCPVLGSRAAGSLAPDA